MGIVPSFGIDNKGISLLIVNTEKGKRLFNNIKDKIETIPVKYESCVLFNPNLQKPTTLSAKRFEFKKDYVTKGFKYVLYKYGNVSWRYRLRKKIIAIKIKINTFIYTLKSVNYRKRRG
jgi:hypothetical protein